MTRVALITGINGQDGSYLAELLLEKGYKVCGIIRRHANNNRINIAHIEDKLELFWGDITDTSSIQNAFNKIYELYHDFTVLEVYNLAAQSHVKVSFDVPEYTGQVDALGTLRLLEIIRNSPHKSKIRFYQASTSELYGAVLETPQTEKTPFNPRSPYAVAKLYSYWILKNYRDAYGLFASNGILFNHTSPRRGENFMCRKITMGVAAIAAGKQTCITLGNLNAFRDLGHAKDYVRGMWMILQADKPDDYVLSMKYGYTVRQIVEMAFAVVGVKIVWKGEGLSEVGVDEASGETRVRVSAEYFRPTEVELLIGNSEKARTTLGWEPSYSTEQIIKEMVSEDLLKTK